MLIEFFPCALIGTPSHPFWLRWNIPFVRVEIADCTQPKSDFCPAVVSEVAAVTGSAEEDWGGQFLWRVAFMRVAEITKPRTNLLEAAIESDDRDAAILAIRDALGIPNNDVADYSTAAALAR